MGCAVSWCSARSCSCDASAAPHTALLYRPPPHGPALQVQVGAVQGYAALLYRRERHTPPSSSHLLHLHLQLCLQLHVYNLYTSRPRPTWMQQQRWPLPMAGQGPGARGQLATWMQQQRRPTPMAGPTLATTVQPGARGQGPMAGPMLATTVQQRLLSRRPKPEGRPSAPQRQRRQRGVRSSPGRRALHDQALPLPLGRRSTRRSRQLAPRWAAAGTRVVYTWL